MAGDDTNTGEEESTGGGGDTPDFDGKYQMLLESAPEAIFIADADTLAISEVNRRALELTGYAESELLETDILTLHPESERDRYERLFGTAHHESARSRFEDGRQLVLERADGGHTPVEMSVSRTDVEGRGVVQSIVRDITRRREREEALRLRNRALEESTVGITIGDAGQRDNPIVYANEGFEQLTGYSRGEILGRNCRFLQGGATDEETVANIREAIDAEESIRTELLNYRAGGTPFWNRLTIAPVTGADDDSVSHYVGIQEDITAQKRRNRLIEVLERVLRHNLRNDMNTIGGFADIIRDRTDGEVADYADRIETTAAELTALSEKARKLESMVRDADPLDVRDVVADVDAVVADLRADHPETEFRVDADGVAEVMATDQLRLALRELGTNAAKHGGGSPVSVSVSAGEPSVTVTVRDDGPGLPEHELRVLETGEETPLEHGSGLGLWLVHWIVTGFGGEVSAETDDGTSVTIRLPAVSDRTDTTRLNDHQFGAFDTKLE